MNSAIAARMQRVVLSLILGATTTSAGAWASEPGGESAVELGRRIYRDGIGAEGKPVTALVQGDVPFDGTQFACVSCHRRSGWGATEGGVIVLPVTAPALFAPRSGGYRPRPAYTKERLVGAIRDGVDPDGQAFDPLMPRYDLTDKEANALAAYLGSLSATPSPGVTDDEIHIATVVTAEVPAERRNAMLEVIDTYFQEKNALTRNERRRLETAPFYRASKDRAYRTWVLHPWSLGSDPGSWRAELEALYGREPVFALVSGVSSGDWRPIHEFCESQEIPCLLPNTDRPKVSESDYYTTYFSKGLSFDAQIVAADIKDEATIRKVLQVYRDDGPGRVAADELRRLLGPGKEIVDLVLRTGDPVDDGLLRGYDVVALWLNADDLAAIPSPLSRLYFSVTLLGEGLERIPSTMRSNGYLVQPFRLPREREGRLKRARAWLSGRDIQLIDERLQEQTYFACLMLAEGLKHIRQYYYREYFIETLEHAERMTTFSAFYPRLSIGPGQRYLAKGAYLVSLEERDTSPRWIVP